MSILTGLNGAIIGLVTLSIIGLVPLNIGIAKSSDLDAQGSLIAGQAKLISAQAESFKNLSDGFREMHKSQIGGALERAVTKACRYTQASRQPGANAVMLQQALTDENKAVRALLDDYMALGGTYDINRPCDAILIGGN